MKSSTVPAIAASAIADLVSVLMGSVPLSTAQTTTRSAFDNYLSRKSRDAEQILLEEISQGIRLSSDVASDCFFALLFKYIMAAKHGAARLNLRLLAGLINGSTKASIEIRSDELAYYAELIAQLSRDEIMLIATHWKHYSKAEQVLTADETRELKAFREASAELVPAYFPSDLHLRSVYQSAARTGLIVPIPGWDGGSFDVGPLLSKIIQLSSFEAAMIKESIE